MTCFPWSRCYCSRKIVIPTGERKWIAIAANLSPRKVLLTQVSKVITKMIRRHDQEEREQDGSYHWDTVRSVLLKACAQEGAEHFSDNHWIQLIQQGSSSKKRIEYCLDNKKSLCCLRAIQGHSGGVPMKPRNDGIHIYSAQLERVCISQGIFMGFLFYFGKWTNSGREKERLIPTSSLFHTCGFVRKQPR